MFFKPRDPYTLFDISGLFGGKKTSTVPTTPGQPNATPEPIELGRPSAAPAASSPTGAPPAYPDASNSHNDIVAAQAKLDKAKGRLGTIYTSNYGIAAKTPVSLSKAFITGV